MACSWTQKKIDDIIAKMAEWEFLICKEKLVIERELDKIRDELRAIDKKLALPKYAGCKEPPKGKILPCWKEVLRLRKLKITLQNALLCKCATNNPPKCKLDIGDKDTMAYCGKIRFAYKNIDDYLRSIKDYSDRLQRRGQDDCNISFSFPKERPRVKQNGQIISFGNWKEYFQFQCRQLFAELAIERQERALRGL